MLELSKGIGIRDREYIQWCFSDGGPRPSAIQKPLSSIVESKKVTQKRQLLTSIFVTQTTSWQDRFFITWIPGSSFWRIFHKRDHILNYIKKKT